MEESRLASEKASRRWTVAWRPVVAALLVVALATVVGCSAARRRAAIPAELRIGMATNYPPLAFAESGRLKGVEADFAGRLGPALGVKVRLVETPWEDLIPALRDDRIDVIMSGMSITPERAKLVRFTDPYLRLGQMALVRKADYRRLRDRAVMGQTTSRVGVIKDSTGERFARRKLSSAQLRSFRTVDEAVAALRAGQIDYFIDDAPAIWGIAAGPRSPEPELRGLYTALTEEELAWAVRLQDAALHDRLNEVLERWRASGELEDVLDAWIRVRVETLPIPLDAPADP